ncbi:cytochrome P450 [Micromonospora sp. NPDC048905]|uniref:cytochrome P450 n=1 Tax=unclassified Micromonospora TaxID=2617518 RepID=UPI0033D6806C
MSIEQQSENTTSPPAACPVSGQRGNVCPVPHGPKGLPLIGDAGPYFRDPLGYTLDTQQRYGPMVGVKLPVPFIQVTEPDAIERVLRTNPDNYVRGKLYRGFAPYMGRGLLTLDTAEWKTHRRVVQPAFTPQRTRNDAVETITATSAVLDRWAELAHRGEPVDIADDVMSISARVIGAAVVGRDLSKPETGYSEAAAIASKVMYTKTVFGINELLPKALPTRYHRERRWAHQKIDAIVRDAVTSRGRTGDTGDDPAGRLLGSDLSDQGVADSLRTLLLAGSDTTGQAMIWTLYELARHPGERRVVEEEVDRVLAGNPPTIDDVDRLPAVAAAVDEALRLYPPVWQFPRDSIADDTVAGRFVPGGTTLLMSVYGTHRSAELWTDPNAFDPARFRTATTSRHRYAYLPFGGGRRMCIGKALALATCVLAVAMISQRFRLRLVRHDIRPGTYITLFPTGGVPAYLEERS